MIITIILNKKKAYKTRNKSDFALIFDSVVVENQRGKPEVKLKGNDAIWGKASCSYSFLKAIYLLIL